ncbi:MAG: NTP transferase domain-containing protein [Elusimicrobiales bacterium]|nr:NTP transferase domain-containing protein [Elusimicrobiales bacterium]
MKNNEFSAIVPVAGEGTRLRPHTHTYPKVLLTVGDKPIIAHILDDLRKAGIRKVYMIIGYMGDKIKEYIGANYPKLKVTYIVQGEAKGLGHAIWMAKDYVEGPALIMLGDTILSADINKFLKPGINALAVKEVEDPRRFGVVESKGGYIRRVVEKPQHPASNTAIVGIYSFNNSSILFGSLDKLVASGKTTKGEIQLTDALDIMIKSGIKIKPITIEGWYDCGKPETLLATNRYILKKKKMSAKRKGVVIIDPVYMAETAKIKNSIIGPNVSIGENAEISWSMISDSIIGRDAIISNVNLNESLVGSGIKLKGQVKRINIGDGSEISFE